MLRAPAIGPVTESDVHDHVVVTDQRQGELAGVVKAGAPHLGLQRCDLLTS